MIGTTLTPVVSTLTCEEGDAIWFTYRRVPLFGTGTLGCRNEEREGNTQQRGGDHAIDGPKFSLIANVPLLLVVETASIDRALTRLLAGTFEFWFAIATALFAEVPRIVDAVRRANAL